MRILRIVVLVIFILTSIAFSYVYINKQLNKDKSIPVIKSSEDVIKVRVNATDKELSAGLTASDEKDGDLTSSIVVESISRFKSKNTADITYAVSDSDNHVAKLTRKIEYSDYTSPRFYLLNELRFFVGSSMSIAKNVGAKDVIDGDISYKAKIVSSDVNPLAEGVYTVVIQVTNSMGDTAELPFKVAVRYSVQGAPTITLKNYLLYTKVGQAVNPYDNILDFYNASIEKKLDKNKNLSIKYEGDFSSPGVCYITYTATNELGLKSETILTVVVEE